MKKAIGIIYLVFGIVGILSIVSAIFFIFLYFGWLSVLVQYPIYRVFDANYVGFEAAYMMISMAITYGFLFLISTAVSITYIILGSLALANKMSGTGVALGAIICGAIAGDITILVLGIVYMVQIGDENKNKQQLTVIETANSKEK